MNINSAFQEFIEFDFKELEGKKVDFFTAPEDIEKSLILSTKLRKNEIDDFTLEKRYKTKSNKIKWAVVKAAMIPDEHNKPEVVIAQVIDINERKKAEMEKEEFLKMLHSKNEELESIVYVTSHDLRSPLVNIQGFSKEIQIYHQQLLEKIKAISDESLKNDIESIIKNDLIDSFQYIYKSSIKMDQLLNGLLKLSRLGRINYDVVEINMTELIQTISGIIKYQLNATDTEIIFNELIPCYGDLLQINQLFSNLIDNAIKYRAQNRKCKIEIWSEKINDNYANYFVKDNGVGIAEMHQHKIFELFHRLNPDSDIKGEGLGLTIIKRIVERHKGEILVKSKENLGSTFIIKLPIQKFESNI
jgi:PAS domain S-box-containing protein